MYIACCGLKVRGICLHINIQDDSVPDKMPAFFFFLVDVDKIISFVLRGTGSKIALKRKLM